MQEPQQSLPGEDAERVVYVVANWPGGGNDRVRKLLRLREQFRGLVLVTPGDEVRDDPRDLVVPPWPNPLGVLRLLGFNRLKRAVERYLYFPSTHVLFVHRVKRRVVRRIAADVAAGRTVTLLTTAPPHALGLIGLFVKSRFPEVRWVVDWQDLWSYDENYLLPIPPRYRDRARRLEQRMLAAADLNLTTNARAMAVLRDVYGVARNRLDYVHHHFDRADFAGAGNASDLADVRNLHGGRVVRIGFLGTLFKPPRVPGREVVDVVAQLRAEGHDVELHVHGGIEPNTRAELEGLDGLVLHGRVSHEDSVRQLAGYDYLLLLLADLANCRAVMSIKLPHYMIVGRPILAIVPGDSAIADIVSDTGTGHVVPVEGDWRTALRRILTGNDAAGHLNQRDPQAIEAYSWDRLSRRWRSAISGSTEHR